MDMGFDWIVRYGYGAIFVLLMLGIVGLPIPDETLLLFVGYLSGNGTLRLERGKYGLLPAYFIPGIRHVAALVVGASLLPPTVFARFAYAGALLWSGTFIGVGFVAGEEWRQLSPLIHGPLLLGALLAFLVLFALILLMVRGKLTSPER